VAAWATHPAKLGKLRGEGRAKFHYSRIIDNPQKRALINRSRLRAGPATRDIACQRPYQYRGQLLGTTPVTVEQKDPFGYRPINVTFVEMAMHAGFIALLAYWSFVLVSPFLPIIVWSVVLAVALYPIYDWLTSLLRGRQRLAATAVTIAGLLVAIGPVAWLGIGLLDGLETLIERLNSGKLVSPPPDAVKDWPLIGPQLYDFWSLASTNLRSALSSVLPALQPIGQFLLGTASNAGTWMLTFLLSVIIAGFLFSSGPQLAAATKTFALKLDSKHGEEFVHIAGTTIRAVSRGVIGVSLLESVVGGVGMAFAGVPFASLLAVAILVLGIIQIGPLIVVLPLIVWSWFSLTTGGALAFTACMAMVSIIDNFLKPFVLTRGLATPMLVTLIGVIGGVLTYGVAGLFVGPVVLAVAWDLADAWIHDTAAPPA
jgi:predicted PurR-regulated permease PerM